GVGGGWVGVVAVGGRSVDARSGRAGVVRRAGVPVVASGGVVRVDASGRRIAGVVCARVAVIAVRRRSTDTRSGRAGVVRRAGARVVARGVGGGCDSSGRRGVGRGATTD